MTKSVLQILREARELILDPNKWTQGTFTNDKGQICASQALRLAEGGPYLISAAYQTLSRAMGQDGSSPQVCNFNDSHTHAEVIAAFDRAIAAEETV